MPLKLQCEMKRLCVLDNVVVVDLLDSAGKSELAKSKCSTVRRELWVLNPKTKEPRVSATTRQERQVDRPEVMCCELHTLVIALLFG